MVFFLQCMKKEKNNVSLRGKCHVLAHPTCTAANNTKNKNVTSVQTKTVERELKCTHVEILSIF